MGIDPQVGVIIWAGGISITGAGVGSTVTGGWRWWYRWWCRCRLSIEDTNVAGGEECPILLGFDLPVVGFTL